MFLKGAKMQGEQAKTNHRDRKFVVLTFYFLAFCLITTGCVTNHIHVPGGNRLDAENFRGMKLWYRQPAQKWTEALVEQWQSAHWISAAGFHNFPFAVDNPDT